MNGSPDNTMSEIVSLTRRMDALAVEAPIAAPGPAVLEVLAAIDATPEDARGRAPDAGLAALTGHGPTLDPQAEVTDKARAVLIQSLRHALRLEFATIPPYLTALWSILDQRHPAAVSIRAVAHEEMLHLSLICNLLVGLGEAPDLLAAAPAYPLRMADLGIDMTLSLRGLGPQSLQDFMRIERPETPVQIIDEPLQAFDSGTNTIGLFYQSILRLYHKFRPPLSGVRQIAGPFTWFVMTTPGQVTEAIEVIMGQGEGAHGTPFNRYNEYLSHYYRFRSLAMGRELRWDAKARALRKADPIRPASTYDVPPPPTGGYGPATPAQIRRLNDQFNTVYTAMVQSLEACWLGEGEKAFLRALERMFELRPLAQAMMREPGPDGRGYCPTFQLIGFA